MITESDIVRFNKKVDKTADCWIWTGARKVTDGKKTYGNFWWNGKYINAHKFSALLHGILINPELKVLHTCDNNACVNPQHLYQGTLKQNSKDAVDRDRLKPWRRGMEVCDRGHEMTVENTWLRGDRKRCMVCKWLRQTASNYRRNGRVQDRTLDKLASLGYTLDKLLEELEASPYINRS